MDGFLLDRPEEAVRYLSAAVAIRPRSVVAHNDLGAALNNQGKLDEAMAECREAIRLKHDYARCPCQPRSRPAIPRKAR